MAFQVMEDYQAGYALLLLEKQPDQNISALSIRRLWDGNDAFLGPMAEWTKTPHYFRVERGSWPDGRACYRLGPSIVNSLHPDDHVEVGSDDGSIKESGYWEDIAIGPLQPSPVLPSPLPVPSPPPMAPPSPMAPLAAPPSNGRRWGALAIASILALGIAGSMLVQKPVLCDLFHTYCDVPSKPRVLACLASKKAAEQWCSMEDCVSAQPSRQFDDTTRVEIDGALADGRQQCALQTNREAENRRQEALAQNLEREKHEAEQRRKDAERARRDKLFEAQRCVSENPCVANACFTGFLRSYPADREAQTALASAAALHPECDRPTGSASVPDGVYSAIAEGGCGHGALQHVRADLHGGKISWQHDAPLTRGGPEITFRWIGTIDSSGNVRASVEGYESCQASGRIDEDNRDIALKYPFCDAPVTLTLRQRTSD